MNSTLAMTEKKLAFVSAPPRLSSVQANEFYSVCEKACSESVVQLILDFSQTSFIDSRGIGTLVQLHKFTKKNAVKIVIWSPSEFFLKTLDFANIRNLFHIEVGSEALNPASIKPIIELPETHPSTRSVFKRQIDILGSIVGLGITALIFVPIAIAIKLDSPGPIFFSQIRCGLMGRKFRMWKFRSMSSDAESQKHTVKNEIQGAFFKNENDPRITRVGRFLRKTSLDEFPQFWNVLTGDMSLVGTRPPTIDEVQQYHIYQWERLNVKPGITGEWQVRERSAVRSFEQVINLDLQYQQKWSILYDLQLIWETILLLLLKKSKAC